MVLGFLERFLSSRGQDEKDEEKNRRVKLEREERLKESARIWKVIVFFSSSVVLTSCKSYRKKLFHTGVDSPLLVACVIYAGKAFRRIYVEVLGPFSLEIASPFQRSCLKSTGAELTKVAFFSCYFF